MLLKVLKDPRVGMGQHLLGYETTKWVVAKCWCDRIYHWSGGRSETKQFGFVPTFSWKIQPDFMVYQHPIPKWSCWRPDYPRQVLFGSCWVLLRGFILLAPQQELCRITVSESEVHMVHCGRLLPVWNLDAVRLGNKKRQKGTNGTQFKG